MAKRYALLTFGCQMNIHDGERISGVLEAAGWRESSLEDADAVILLTCCVRASAERRFLGRLASLKPLKEGRGVTIAVGGCLAQKEGVRLLQTAPHVDLVFGTHQYPNIAALLEEAVTGPTCALDMDGLRLHDVPVRRREGFRAWITISHGCDNFCSYCVVPYVRGREVSRPVDEILAEAGRHASEGVREIVLLGQNVDSYRLREEGRSRFADLLRRLGSTFPDVWIRFLTSHPRDLDRDAIRAIAETPNVCEYVHLPLQSGSDRILASMNRGYDGETYLSRVKALRDSVEGVVLSTDIIVGFPGETAEQFQRTYDLVEELRFDVVHVAAYSPRPGTRAALLPDDVPTEEKKRRLDLIETLQERIVAETNQSLVGTTVEILVENRRKGKWEGRTRTNKLVFFSDPRDMRGRIVPVKVEKASAWALQGTLVEASVPCS